MKKGKKRRKWENKILKEYVGGETAGGGYEKETSNKDRARR